MEARPRKVTEATPSAHQAERKVLLLKKSITKQREKYYCKKYYKAEKNVLLLKKKVFLQLLPPHQAERKVLLLKKVLSS